jgi:hypothetical protein
MPLPHITLDDRKYQDLLDEALRRIPVHTPDWTNFNKSDPGVTLLELFAFLTETLLYRVNRIPDRNRRKFLSLLGIPLKAASSARGLVTFQNERGPLESMTIPKGFEVAAGNVPFHTELTLELLPIEGKVFVKLPLALEDVPDNTVAYYRQLYESIGVGSNELEDWQPQLYATVPFPGQDRQSLSLNNTVGQCVWIALLVRESDKPSGTESLDDIKARVRQRIAGKTLNLGIVPTLTETARRLPPIGQATVETDTPVIVERPIVVGDGRLTEDRVPQYAPLETKSDANVLAFPGIVQVTLPSADQLKTWTELEPLESGVDTFPPPIEDTTLNDRLVTWLRVSVPNGVAADLHWLGINATRVMQRAQVFNEALADGTGEPDQTRTLANRPVIPGTVKLSVAIEGQEASTWEEIDDLLSAGPEVPTLDPRLPPGRQPTPSGRRYVFTLDSESGGLRFGDGTHGARLPFGAVVRARYDYGVGAAGNVNAGAITSGPLLPGSVTVTNPVRTWGGAEAETVAEGERQIAKYLQHRDRLVTVEDFQSIVKRTPGVDINRVEIVPVFNPQLIPNEPGDAPGAVTIMVIPAQDTEHPDAPVPNRTFLDAICRYINPRRLVTTEVFLQGPQYVDIWVSIGVDVQAGESVAGIREAVRGAVNDFLSPMSRLTVEEEEAWQERLKREGETVSGEALEEVFAQRRGWPLRKAVVGLELVTVASRVHGVLFVNQIQVAKGAEAPISHIAMSGLELPRPHVFVTVGPPVSLDELRGQVPVGPAPTTPIVPRVVPIPAIPEECR